MLIRQAYLCSVLSTKVPWHGKDKGSVLCIRLRTSVEGFSFLLRGRGGCARCATYVWTRQVTSHLLPSATWSSRPRQSSGAVWKSRWLLRSPVPSLRLSGRLDTKSPGSGFTVHAALESVHSVRLISVAFFFLTALYVLRNHSIGRITDRTATSASLCVIISIASPLVA